MKVYLRRNAQGRMYNADMYLAHCGFSSRAELAYYTTIHSLTATPTRDIVVGLYTDIWTLLSQWGLPVPDEMSYPLSLRAYLGRKLWTSTLFTVTNHPEMWHIFVKPKSEAKRFHGTVLDETKDLVSLGGMIDDLDIWCSDPVHFVSEWRVYICQGEILDITHYAGDWSIFPDVGIIKQAVIDFKDAPAGYAIDMGVTDDGRTLLVECNDGFGLANYGLAPTLYADLLEARWQELVATLPQEEERGEEHE